MAKSSDVDIDKLFSLRISNLNDEITDEDILPHFRQYGAIGNYYRPTTLASSLKPSRFAFVRYIKHEDADRAQRELNGLRIKDHSIQVVSAKQQSFFTQDTGYITNSEFDKPKIESSYFDSSMPSEHYDLKREEHLKAVDIVYAVRVDDLDPEITPEDIRLVFGTMGEISSIYHPTDLKTGRRRDFAIVRYLRKRDAERAVKDLHNVNIGKGRNILVKPVHQITYFSQDESVVVPKKAKSISRK